jgi:hypothetical protein
MAVFLSQVLRPLSTVSGELHQPLLLVCRLFIVFDFREFEFG